METESMYNPCDNRSEKSFIKPTEPLIISVHVPKTAGTSFRHSLQDYFGDSLLLKYGEKPFNTPILIRNQNAVQSAIDHLNNDFTGVRCIHGHFLPVQYLLLSLVREVSFITWMRHPVDRLISDYYHTLKNYGSDAPPFQKRVITEKWSLLQYCLCEELRNIYQQVFWGFPLEYFDFVGISEHFHDDFPDFRNRYLSPEIRIYRENVSENKPRIPVLDHSLRKEIELFHLQDMELYERATEMRQRRKNACVHHQTGATDNVPARGYSFKKSLIKLISKFH